MATRKANHLIPRARRPMLADALLSPDPDDAYPETRPPLRDIANDLDAAALMECSVRYAADRVVVTAQLVDPRFSARMFSETYWSDLDNVDAVFAMQADIARRIARAVVAEITPARGPLGPYPRRAQSPHSAESGRELAIPFETTIRFEAAPPTSRTWPSSNGSISSHARRGGSSGIDSARGPDGSWAG